MNKTKDLFSLITATTAVAALAAGMLLALNAPVPAAEDFGQPVLAISAAADEA